MKFKITSNAKGILGVNFKNEHKSLVFNESFEVEATSLEIKELQRVFRDKISVENISLANNPVETKIEVPEVPEKTDIEKETEIKDKKKNQKN